jgi:hypothetical protein
MREWIADQVVKRRTGARIVGAIVLLLSLSSCQNTGEIDAFEACRTGTGPEPCFAYFNDFPTGAHASEVDDRLFDLLKTSFDGLEKYKTEVQHGRHVQDMPAARQVLFEHAIARYRATAIATADPNAAAGIAAVLRIFEAFKSSDTNTLYIKFVGSTDFLGKHGHLSPRFIHEAYPEKTFTDPGGSLLTSFGFEASPSSEIQAIITQLRESTVKQKLASTFAKLTTEEILEFKRLDPGARLPRTAPVLFTIDYVVFLAPTVYAEENSDRAYYGIGFDWRLTITYPQSPHLQPDVFHIRSLPTLHELKSTKNEFYQSPEYRIGFRRGAQARFGGKTEVRTVAVGGDELYRQIEDSAIQDFAKQLERIAGVAEAK